MSPAASPANDSRLDLVSVFCRRDVRPQALQARSIVRFFERARLHRVIYVWHDPEDLDAAARELVTRAFQEIPFELVTAEELGVRRDAILVDGWTTQQAVKLLAARLVETDDYLVLDAKNHFVRPSSVHDFVGRDGRALVSFDDLSGNPSYAHCLDYFGVSRAKEYCRGVLNNTPFMLKKSPVCRMIERIVGAERKPLADVFLAHQHRLSEFLVYQAYLISEGVRLTDLYRDSPARVSETLWNPTAGRFGCWIDELARGGAKVAAVHWIACCLMSSEEQARLSGFWLERGLVDCVADGRDLIRSVSANLSRSDRAYLARIAA